MVFLTWSQTMLVKWYLKAKKVYKNWIRGRLNAKKRVSKNISKTTSLWPNIGAEVSLKSKAECSLRVMTPGYAEVTFAIDFEIFSISQVSQVVHVDFTSVHSVATSNTTIGHIWFPARTTIKLVLFFIRSTRTMMDFSQKLHRTETLSYRGWNDTFEAFTLPTRPKN